LRNTAVALGNTNTRKVDNTKLDKVTTALKKNINHVSGLVGEHAQWALKNLDRG